MKERQEIILKTLSDSNYPIIGNTKIQKLVFLVSKESIDAESVASEFNFYAHKYGPFSKVLSDDIDFLVGLGYLYSSDTPKSEDITLDNIDDISADDLLSDESPSDEYDNVNCEEDDTEKGNVIYKITDKGLNYLKEKNLLTQNTIDGVVKKYAQMSLTDILYYVYNQYPEYTGESEIKERVLNG
ncbi:MAG: hypothetical protein PHT81_05730 [Endomicrobiaceae bacterium]|nr:hypothetical protein [Endomicrobiaceae bacterium]